MCIYCKDSLPMLKTSAISPTSWAWGGIKISEADASSINIGVKIDRGCLRLVDLDDCNCMDAGQNIEINFCPFCGSKIEIDYSKQSPKDGMIGYIIEDVPKLEPRQLTAVYKSIRRYIAGIA